MKRDNLDERQLWLRGEVFKHCLILMCLMLLMNSFLTQNGISLFDGEWAAIFIVAITAAFGNVEMSLKAVFDFDNMRMSIMEIIIGICGVITLLLNIIDILSGSAVITGGQFTKTGAFLVMSLAFLAMPAACFLMRSRYRKQLDS